MGAHKYNPTAIAAKNGELPPKPPKMSKRERERIMEAKCRELLYGPLIAEYLRYKSMIPGIDLSTPKGSKGRWPLQPAEEDTE